MIDRMSIGTAPYGEDCAMLGRRDCPEGSERVTKPETEDDAMAFKFPCDMTKSEREAYHAKRIDDARRFGAKRFGLRMDEVLFYNSGICYSRIIVTTMRAAQIVAASVQGETVNGGCFDGMSLGGISEGTVRGVKGYDVRC